MNVYLTHTTAACFWLRAQETPEKMHSARRLRRIPDGTVTPNASQLDAIRSLLSHRGPIDVTVSSVRSKRNITGCRTHYATAALPPNAFIPLSNRISIASPEYCLMQLAPVLPAITWIRLAYAFCGTYRRREHEVLGHRETGVTSVTALSDFVAHSTGLHGAKLTRQRLGLIVDASDSPMETRLSMQLHLPKRMGGYHLPQGELNRPFELGAVGRAMAKRNFYKADLCWPDQRVIVEYDSDAYHTGSARIAADARRRNVWLHLDYRPITVTRPQLLSVTEFDRVARQLHKALGITYRRPTEAQWDAKLALHRQLSEPLLATIGLK